MMTDHDRLRIPEIADLLSLREELIRQYADEYDEFLPHKAIGKVRLYEESALKRFRVIADLTAQGMSREGIVMVLKGGKPLQELAPDEGSDAPEKKESRPPPPRPELLDEVVLAANRTLEATSHMDHRIGAIRNGMETNTERILHEIGLLRGDLQASRDELRTLWSQVRELEDDLRERELRKSWLERVARRFSR
ncbi:MULTISPECIES: MerR family transcriptional regulator [Methanocalculus]|uniref:MerR family transcriptional regulator n=1 Tax=Methanocalculus TaxID=71151 RepID=UPI00209FA705|nr:MULTISPECIES: MerR family transcriptional regulator [unclassified Methanocalculus]MCP1662931.1 DNA-binding transcriptional MerR regulator [Methanocalculus sp. AMF5]